MTHPADDKRHIHEQRLRMSYREYLAWSSGDIHTEWVEGEAIVFLPPTTIHALLTGFLFRLMAPYADFFKLGVVIAAPFEMRLIPGKVSREPDILYVARANGDRLMPDQLEGPADLVIEIVSEESGTRDRVQKFEEYERAGVREYWMIDPRHGRQEVDLFHRSPQGRYEPIEPDEKGDVHSVVLSGFWLRPSWLWQEPLPDPLLLLEQTHLLPPQAIHKLRQTMHMEK
jgi:Uma2 family endonuclease